jgi:hypothetical protein
MASVVEWVLYNECKDSERSNCSLMKLHNFTPLLEWTEENYEKNL